MNIYDCSSRPDCFVFVFVFTRDKEAATNYKWFPVPAHDLDHRSMPLVIQCMSIPSTLGLLCGLASGDATHYVESFHSMRCHFASKKSSFQRWAMRNTMAKLHFNENLGRKVKCTYKSKQRRLGKTITKTVKENATWGWQARVVKRTLEYV